MTQRLNVIYKNRLHNFLLRLERSTCVQEKSKQKRKQIALHGLLQRVVYTRLDRYDPSHISPPLDKHTSFFSQIFYDRPPNGRVQYRMTVATVGTDSHDPPPHCSRPPPLCKYPGDDCFQVTTRPPENALGSSPCIYPYVK